MALGSLPCPEDSGTFFIARVFDVMVAAVYAIGMASLLRGGVWRPLTSQAEPKFSRRAPVRTAHADMFAPLNAPQLYEES